MDHLLICYILTPNNFQIKRFLQSKPICWVKTSLVFDFQTHRLEALSKALLELNKLAPDNQGILTGLFMHLIRGIDSEPKTVPHYVKRSLIQLRASSISERFGMVFLHDLQLKSESQLVLPQVDSEDDQDVLQSLMLHTKRKTTKINRRPGEGPSVAYPFGSVISFAKLRYEVENDPLNIIQTWRYDPSWRVGRDASSLFISFTIQIWMMLQDAFRYPASDEIETLDDAMDTWSASKVINTLRNPKMIAMATGLKGSVPGKKLEGFRSRFHTFFPQPEDGTPPRGSQWRNFFQEYHGMKGYIKQYHEQLESAEDPESLNEEMETIFSRIQCLPISYKFMSRHNGKVWTKEANTDRIIVITNPLYYKMKEIGGKTSRVGQQRHANKNPQAFKKSMLKSIGIPEETLDVVDRQKRKERKQKNMQRSVGAKGRRLPPHLKAAPTEGGWIDSNIHHDELIISSKYIISRWKANI